MNDLTKKEAIEKWLESHPEKTELDWLLEERCTTKVQREALKELLECCDACGVKYEIAHHVDLEEEYAKLLATDSKFKALSDKLNGEFETYSKFSAEEAENGDNEYIQHHVFDLYFPHVGWYINIGCEIHDARNYRWVPNAGDYFWGKPHYLGISKKTYNLAKYFNEHLSIRFSIPKSNPIKDTYYDPNHLRHSYYPWNEEVLAVFKDTDITTTGLILEDNAAWSFLHYLFEDRLSELHGFRKERFFKSHPEIREQRSQKLHSLVLKMQERLGLQREISSDKIKTLLKTVDNELGELYPSYKKLL